MSEVHSTEFARQLELAWAAGFFDGEGSTYLNIRKDRKVSHVKMGVAQVEPEPLRKFFGIVGRGGISGPYTEKESSRNAKPIYKWNCSGFPAKEVLAMLWPYLSEVKKQQATVAIAGESNSGKLWTGHRTHCPRGHSYAEHGKRTRDGHRKCRLCERVRLREAGRRYRARKKLQRGNGDE